MSTEPERTSVNWNGTTWTGYANKGARFGQATGPTADTAVAAAAKVLSKDPERTAPEVGATGPVAPQK